jgi:hypothetical protein
MTSKSNKEDHFVVNNDHLNKYERRAQSISRCPVENMSHHKQSPSLRVRFRMITHQSSQIRARISSNSNLYASNHSLASKNFLINSDNRLIVPRSSSSNANLTEYEALHLESYEETSDFITQKQSINHYKSTTQTFKLTDSLDNKSNIRFDVTLKPTYSIRDNRLNCSTNNLHRSSSLDKHTFHEIVENDNQNVQEYPQIEYPTCSINSINSTSSSRNSRQRIQIPFPTNIPLNSSITFKIRNINLNENNNSEKNSATSSLIGSSNTNLNANSRFKSPFTYIETISTRRRESISPEYQKAFKISI